jgi:hypothetical protein
MVFLLSNGLNWRCWHYEDIPRITLFLLSYFQLENKGGKGDLLDENEQFLNIMYDKITTRQGCSLGISEMGIDIRLEWREAIRITEQPKAFREISFLTQRGL